ncbi:MAG: GTP cyclohydrolase I, partial [Candidatus Marinimicrobia bacterium]|nr:GTP cyclohydrolase I [Candidatus Neomarinimicrobiota bacterium]
MKDITKMENLTRELLLEIGEDPDREGLLKTPHRVAKAWRFIAKGYEQELSDVLNDAIFEDKCPEMVVVRDIEFFS